MISVVIIGSGNVAQHLLSAFATNSSISVIQVYTRNKDAKLQDITTEKIIHDWSKLQEADLYIIAVTDQAIPSVSAQIPFQNKLVVHTSGSVAITALDTKNRKGVFYPLQTFSKLKKVDFQEIPICIEAENASDFSIIETVAKAISNKVYAIDSSQRKALHVAAVFVCNFVNHLYQIGSEICAANAIPFEILQPLIEETAAKINTLTPKEAQTGPAKRKDTSTINAHLQFLSDSNQKEIYKLITKSIVDHG